MLQRPDSSDSAAAGPALTGATTYSAASDTPPSTAFSGGTAATAVGQNPLDSTATAGSSAAPMGSSGAASGRSATDLSSTSATQSSPPSSPASGAQALLPSLGGSLADSPGVAPAPPGAVSLTCPYHTCKLSVTAWRSVHKGLTLSKHSVLLHKVFRLA